MPLKMLKKCFLTIVRINTAKKKSETRRPRFSVVGVLHYYISESFL